jgi:hypothetical protein
MTDRELMQMALNALRLWEDAITDESSNHAFRFGCFGLDAIKALSDRLAEPEPEPMAWFMQYADSVEFFWREPKQWEKGLAVEVIPVYTAPTSIEDAVKAEREACAKLCDGWTGADGDRCAEAIRSRGEK